MIYMLYREYNPLEAATVRGRAYFRGLSELKIPATVVYFFPDKERSHMAESFEGISVRYCWEKGYINNSILKYLSYLRYIRQLRKQLKPGDIVYIYGLNDIKARFVGINGVKVFYEVTESPYVSMPGTHLHKPTFEEYMEDCRKMDGIIVISNQLKNFFVSQGIDENKISIVNMTVDANRFSGVVKKKLGRTITYCGTVSNNKDGVDKLIRAFSIVAKHYDDVKLRLLGKIDGVKDAASNIQLIKELDLSDRVETPGQIAIADMPQELINATVLALCRPDNIQAQYGFPTKLGEYLLSGNPVVVTSVGDIPLFLKNGESALLAEPNNEKDFAEKLIDILSDEKMARRIGENGKQVALEKFNYLTETKKLADILDS